MRTTVLTLSIALLAAGAASAPAWGDPGGTQPELPCSQEGHVASQSSARETAITFTNSSSDTLDVYWLDYGGQRVLYAVVAAGSSYTQYTYVTHPWIVTSADGTCLAGYRGHGRASTAVYGD